MFDWDDILRSSAVRPRRELDLPRVMERASVLRRRKHLIAASALVLIAVATITGLKAAPLGDTVDTLLPPSGFGGDSRQQGAIMPSETQAATYLLSAFAIEHPYVAAAGDQRHDDHFCRSHRGACEPDSSRAEVTFEMTWATEDFPGLTRCRLQAFDEAGAPVGSGSVDLEDLDPNDDASGAALVMDVSGEPATASGECEAGDYPPGPGFRFEFVSATDPADPPHGTLPADRVELTFITHYLVDDPGTRSCRLIVTLRNGEERVLGEYSQAAPENGSSITLTPSVGAPSDVSNAAIECGPWTAP